MWRKEVLKEFNIVETDAGGRVAAHEWQQSGACSTPPDRARLEQQTAERE
jgi:hypothetical protein